MKKQLTKQEAIRYYSDAKWLFKDEQLTIEEYATKIAEYLIETHGGLKAQKIMKFIKAEISN
jgi:hypothetical protein